MRRALPAVLLGGLIPLALSATEVRLHGTPSQATLLQGSFEGVSLDSFGRLRLADRAQRLGVLREATALAVAAHPQGWVVGGRSGNVLLVGRDGASRVLFTTPEPEVLALAVDADGTVFAASSPHGKVYRVTAAGGTPFFAPGETYIWALARAPGGELLVATGAEAKLFAVDRDGGGRLLYASREPHLRSLAVLPGGAILVGTAGKGLIVELTPAGQAQPRFSEGNSEIVALAPGPDGTAYAAVLASERPGEAPPLVLGAGPPLQPAEALSGVAPPAAAAGASPPWAAAAGGAPPPGGLAKIVRLGPDGAAETLWQFADESVYGLLWARERLWIGSGPAGRLYSHGASGLVVEQAVAQKQITGLAADGAGVAFLTNNSAGLYRLALEPERSGTYTSPPVDALEVARFGAFRWRGEETDGGSVAFAFRSGLTATPDDTWSSWTVPEAGREIDLSALPDGRYLQWLALFRRGPAGTPRLDAVEISYQQRNRRPRLKSFTALDPGQILVPPAFSPTDQVYEPAHPNRDGIFTTLRPTLPDPTLAALKQLWKQGFRSFRWSAEDPNGDRLVYDLAFTSDALGGEWLPAARDLRDDYYNFDGTVLPEGLYRFRLVASDRPSNEAGGALEAEQVSDGVVVDHSPPVLAGVEARGADLLVAVRDAWSQLREAAVSVDAGEWVPANPVEGLVDGPSERFLVPLPPGAKLVLLRVTDAAWNTATFDLSNRARGPRSAKQP